MAELEVAQAQLVQHVDLAFNRRLIGKELDAVLDRHFQYVGDTLVLVLHIERVLIVAGTLASRAGDFDVRA